MSIKTEEGAVTIDGEDLKQLQDHARSELEKMRPPDGTPAVAVFETPYAVICDEHGKVCLTEDEYSRQLCRPDSFWSCPKCGEFASWDDDHYEKFFDNDDGPDGPDVHDENCQPHCACKFPLAPPS